MAEITNKVPTLPFADLHAGVRYEAFPESAAEMGASRSAFIFAVRRAMSAEIGKD